MIDVRFVRVALALVGAGLMAASAPALAAAPQDDAELRALMSQTWFHGVTEEVAAEVAAQIGPDAGERLRRLLEDPSFERVDNVVVFLAYLSKEDPREALLSYLSSPRHLIERPEADRAHLLVPELLGVAARRGHEGSLDALLAMLAPGASHPAIEAAAAKPGVPSDLARTLAKSALAGLAFAESGEARARLRELAAGAEGPASLPQAAKPASRMLELADAVDRARALRGAGIEPQLGEITPSGALPASGAAGDASPASSEGGTPAALSAGSASLEGGDIPEPLSETDTLDTDPDVDEHVITWANHVDVPSPISAPRLDDVLAEASLRLGRADYDGDIACCVTAVRGNDAQSFGSPGDGLDIIDTSAELTSVLQNPISRAKVVRQIRYCGGPGSNIIGCAYTPGDGLAVVRLSSVIDEAIVWIHEYGHNTGLPHSGDFRHIMFASLNGSNRGVTSGQCSTYHNPSFFTEAVVSRIGACLDADGDEVHNLVDNCPSAANTAQTDSDGDTAGDACDNCAGEPNPDQADFDNDGAGNVCDADDDNDGVNDVNDCAPLNAAVSAEAGPASALDFAVGSKERLTWNPGAEAELSNLYRGTIDPVYSADASCLRADIPGDVADDPSVPPAGTAFYYLVTGQNVCGESDASTGSDGQPRSFTPCP